SSGAENDGARAIQKISMNHDTKDPRPNTIMNVWGLNQYSSEYSTVSNSRWKRSIHISEACVPKSLQKCAFISTNMTR
ncbi:hypothetical protein DOY81_005867, partial [Sarcophaga bullata]